MGSEMLLLCDQDWKDSVKERVMFGLTKIKAHRFIFSFSIYKKENIFFPHKSLQAEDEAMLGKISVNYGLLEPAFN